MEPAKEPSNMMDSLKGDSVVITGISGNFPNAENTQELSRNLYNMVDMVSKNDNCGNIKHPEAPKYLGKLKYDDKFDAQFFKMTPSQAAICDPVGKAVLKHTYSAIFDAGINPVTLGGSKLGVFISHMHSEKSLVLYDAFNISSLIIYGLSNSMLANRISFWIDGRGPSYGIDNGNGGSMTALEMAYKMIKSGEIDSAIVGGANICNLPVLDVSMRRAGLLCLDGKTKCFDKIGDGYVKSDAVNVLFLQRAKDAKRIYSEIVHVKGKYFAAPNGSFSMQRNPKDIEKFLEEFYSDIDVSPEDVEYVEANGSGIADADGNELEAIENIFAKGKTLKVGSVKSNMGNTENASGACSVTKMCLAYQNGQIPANLHFKEPLSHITSLESGRMQIVTKNTAFNRGYTAINNFCYTGANFHLLLNGHYKPKAKESYLTEIPRLLLVSGRQENSVNKMFDIIENSPVDPEQYALLDNIFQYKVPGHTGRGYIILEATFKSDDSSTMFSHIKTITPNCSNENKNAVRISRSFEYFSENTPPIWFLYSGMGSQWAGMGDGLLKFSVFRAAIKKCDKVLKPKGIDIFKIITDKDSKTLNILNSLLAITAIQIGLTDVLKSLGIVPDNIIGHSVGEIACGYADGALTAEQTILASYSRAIVAYQTKFVKGKMAAVGLGHQEVSKLCPPEIEVACHNSSESTTLSGPADIVSSFVKELTNKKIFAREVASYDIAFHSKYVLEAGPEVLRLLKEVIREPKLRTNKWLSTCFLPQDWGSEESQYASAEYFTHNLLGNVLLEEAAQQIPDNAIIIELAPHGLLQAIMKRSHSKCVNLPLTRRGETQSEKFLLEAIGKLYQNGLNPDIKRLYPTVEFPVSSETPPLSHFIHWDYSVSWCKPDILVNPNKSTFKEFIISTQHDDFKFLEDHVRNGMTVLPEAAILVFAWETFAEYKEVDYLRLSVKFGNVKFHNELIFKPDEILRLAVTIQKGTSRFEVTQDNDLIADGYIYTLYEANRCDNITFSGNDIYINKHDVYSLLSSKGYSYGKEFQNLISTNIRRNKATIRWNNQWVTFLDSLIQFNGLARDFNGISTVKMITKLTINIQEHTAFRITTANEEQYYNAVVLNDIGETRCPGVILKDVVYNDIATSESLPQILFTRKFITHISTNTVDIHTALLINLQVLSENITGNVITVNEIASHSKETVLNIHKDLIDNYSFFDKTIKIMEHMGQDVNLLILHNIFENNTLIEPLINNNMIDNNYHTYILAIETKRIDNMIVKNMKPLTFMYTANGTVVLLKKVQNLANDSGNISVISTRLNTDMTIRNSKYEPCDKDLIRILEKGQYYEQDTLKALETCDSISFYILDSKFPKLSVTNYYCRDNIQKGVKVKQALSIDTCGSFCYVPTSSQSPITTQNISLIAKEQNNFESLTWVESPSILHKKSIQVCYSGLSMRDCKNLCRTQVEESKCFGMDFSGIDSNGTRVMGLLPNGTMASIVEADHDLLWPVPQHWTLEEAASVPLPYIHALYCLTIRSSIHKKSNIFIIGAAGALGQAVIGIALSLNCAVYCTVGNADKKKLLLKLFPELDENNIGYTYDDTFHAMVVTRTNNILCDIVINNGTGEIRKAGMDCVGYLKCFLDVNDTDQMENEPFNMTFLQKMKSYKSVNLHNVFTQKYINHKKALQLMLSDGIARGFVRPLTSVVFTPVDISRAFQLLSGRVNRGRVLINMKDDMTLSKQLKAIIPRISLVASSLYVIACDGSELSIELIDRLVQRGAKHLQIHVNPNRINGHFQVRHASWTQLGVNIEVITDSLEEEYASEILITKLSKVKPVHGIFIAYNACNKKSVTKVSEEENIKLVVSNLDKASRGCSDLRYFVIIASTSNNADKKEIFDEIEKCCLKRDEQCLPALFLKHIHSKDNTKTLLPKTLSVLFDAMESSIKNEYVSVLSLQPIDKNISNHVKSNTNFDGGFKVFFSHIMEDECTASEPIVQMRTSVSLAIQHELYVNPDDTYLLMIPGLDGNHKILNAISETLKKPALALQFNSNEDVSITEIAKNLLKFVKKRINLKSPFYLMGYSFGVNIALEMASLLESEGLVGIVYCLDSSPDAMRVHLNAYLGNLSDEQMQNSLILHMFSLLARHESSELQEILENTKSWNDKLDIFINNVKDYATHSHQFLRTLVQGAYNRIKLIKEYKPKFALKSELILIRGIPHPSAEQVLEDYSLSQYCKKPVLVYNIQSNHALAPMDCRVSNFINRTLI